MKVEHEVDQRARQSRAGSDKRSEACSRDFGTALEVDDAERRPQIPMRLGSECECLGGTVAPHLDIGRGVLANGYARVRDIGNDEEMTLSLVLDRVELGAHFLDALRPLTARLLNSCDVAPLALGPRRLFARGILLAFQSLDQRNDAAPFRVNGGKSLELGAQIHSTILERGAD